MTAPAPTSLIDVVDDEDRRVGTIRRGDVLGSKKNFRTAHVFVINDAREILLQRLAPSRSRHPGRFGSSVAAYLFAGESYQEAAERRIREELEIGPRVRPLGKLAMEDEGSRKFVALFEAESDRAAIGAPDQISELVFVPEVQIRDRLAIDPDCFTPTFAALFKLFGGERG
jgi:isopentenyldiphosphate isomerase